jgi:malate dehydrogenase
MDRQEKRPFMAHTISIIGASGAVGSVLATHILRCKLLKSGDRLQLVGRGIASSSSKLLSMRIDLMDAFDDEGVDIEVVSSIEDTDGDIVVVCSGATLDANIKDRRALSEINLKIFREIAEICSYRVPESLFIIVSNPVELAVEVFSNALGSKRVIGMGAEQDSLRFARAIAHDLGLSRHDVFASVLGEHGQSMTPLWSTVRLNVEDESARCAIHRMIENSEKTSLAQRVEHLKAEVSLLLDKDQVDEAYEATRRALPDARIFIQPLITLHAIHSTPNATANAAVRFLTAVLAGTNQRLHGQVKLSGEFEDIYGVCGVPIHVDDNGWRLRPLETLTAEDRYEVRSSAASIAQYLADTVPEEAMCVASL